MRGSQDVEGAIPSESTERCSSSEIVSVPLAGTGADFAEAFVERVVRFAARWIDHFLFEDVVQRAVVGARTAAWAEEVVRRSSPMIGELIDADDLLDASALRAHDERSHASRLRER